MTNRVALRRLTPARHPAGGRHPDSLANTVLDVDLVVNASKLKTHLTRFAVGGGHTAILCFPRRGGPRCGRPPACTDEGCHPGNETLWRTILDVNVALLYGRRDGSLAAELQRRVLHIVDGVVGGEGDGPLRPTQRPAAVLMASFDPVAVEAVGAEVVGFAGEHLPTVSQAGRTASYLVGEGDRERIEMAGDAVEPCRRRPPFHPPPLREHLARQANPPARPTVVRPPGAGGGARRVCYTATAAMLPPGSLLRWRILDQMPATFRTPSSRRKLLARFVGIAAVLSLLGGGLLVGMALFDNQLLDALNHEFEAQSTGPEDQVLRTLERVSACAQYFNPERIASPIERWVAKAEHRSPLHLSTLAVLAAGADHIGQCGSLSRSLIVLLRRAGFEVRKAILYSPDGKPAHTIVEVKLDGEWRVLDPTYAWCWRRPRDGQLATVADIRSDPELFRSVLAQHPEYPIGRYVYDDVNHLRWEKVPGLRVLRRFIVHWRGEEWTRGIRTPYIYERPRIFVGSVALALGCFLLLGAVRIGRRPRASADGLIPVPRFGVATVPGQGARPQKPVPGPGEPLSPARPRA